MKKKLSVAFLWHMHQPLYKDLVSGKYYLPWVRLHSTYSYLDMASIIDEYPDAKVTFNITPSLIWQLEDISSGGGADDIYLSLSRKNAADLSDEEKGFILKNFFSCDPANAILPVKKYSKLFSRRGDVLGEDVLVKKAKGYSVSDMRDLQVFFNLAWCGFTLRKNETLIKDLVHKGGGYTEEEKHLLLDKQMEVVSSILPLYKRLQDSGSIEISTSPYYHPILPLLCSKRSKYGSDFADDADHQVSRAIELYEQVFGRKPAGMWPSEGSVSPDIIPIMAGNGIKWIATDEGILLESFSGEDVEREELLYRPFSAENEGSKVDIIFRDINISNAISFKYAKMTPSKAVEDVIRDVNGIRSADRFHNNDQLVSIILDGENPWPYYNDGGYGFLSGIYKSMTEDENIDLVTINEYLENTPERKEIKRLYSGSWIDRNFNKWSGSPQKDKAWDYLEQARKDLFSLENPPKEALEELYIAEGSDWFWWYDDFGTELNYIFDDLFRLHLSNLYNIIGKKVPKYLKRPILAGPSVQKIPEGSLPSEMARFQKVLVVASECIPFAKTGGLADVVGSLPKALISLGCDVRVIIPLYKGIRNGGFDLVKAAGAINKPLPESLFGFDLYEARTGGITIYFVKNDRYFAREGLYGTPKGDYHDNGQRFSFFCKAVLDAVKAIDFKPDVIHCNDWQTALIPFYLKFKLTGDSFYRGIRTLFTIHNMAYQGVFNKRLLRKAGIPESFFNINDLEFYGKVNFMKSGILYSDAVNTVSHRYAEEIMTSGYGAGLDGLLRTRKEVLYGIPNGVDYSMWSPKHDHFIASNFDSENLEGKIECKKDLLKDTGLDIPLEAPLIGCVSRLAHQKGMDLLAEIAGDLVGAGAGLVILGRGDEKYNRMFSSLAGQYPGKIYVCSDFNDELAHKIEAGCDIYAMPSRYEPCGLNQMYSIKYGTVPVVRATGGLDDVIVDFDDDPSCGNGFKFLSCNKQSFCDAVLRAIDLYRKDKDTWHKLMRQGMSCDFSWTRSAQQYLKLYRKILSQ